MAAPFSSAGGKRSVSTLPTADQQETLASGHLQVVPHREPELLQPAAAEPQARHGVPDPRLAVGNVVVQVAHRAASGSAEAPARRRRIVEASRRLGGNHWWRKLGGRKRARGALGRRNESDGAGGGSSGTGHVGFLVR